MIPMMALHARLGDGNPARTRIMVRTMEVNQGLTDEEFERLQSFKFEIEPANPSNRVFDR